MASITVCPDQAPVGGTVHITIKGCAGSEDFPAAGLYFLGPDSWLGTDGGGGKNVPYSPETGSREATATFVIPASYTGGNENGPYPTLLTRPGRYVFITDPAGECYVPFTVTAWLVRTALARPCASAPSDGAAGRGGRARDRSADDLFDFDLLLAAITSVG